MKFSPENIILISSILLIASIIANKTSYKLGIPTLIFFLLVGMLAGSEGIGKIYFNDPHLAEILGVLALNFILFSGGMDTKWESVKPIVWRGVALSTLGVLLTATIVGIELLAAAQGVDFHQPLQTSEPAQPGSRSIALLPEMA